MLPWAMPNTRNRRQPAPVTPPWAIVFHDPVTTPNPTRTATASSVSRWIGNRSASVTVLGRGAVSTGLPLCSVMSTSGVDPTWARLLVAAERGICADREVGRPGGTFQVGLGERHRSPSAHFDPVLSPFGHREGEPEQAVVVPPPQGLLAEGAVPQRGRPDHRPRLVAYEHRRARMDVGIARVRRYARRTVVPVPEDPVDRVVPVQPVDLRHRRLGCRRLAGTAGRQRRKHDHGKDHHAGQPSHRPSTPPVGRARRGRRVFGGHDAHVRQLPLAATASPVSRSYADASASVLVSVNTGLAFGVPPSTGMPGTSYTAIDTAVAQSPSGVQVIVPLSPL